MGVAGGHNREAKPPGEVQLTLHAILLDVQAVVLNFDEEVSLAEGLVVPHGELLGLTLAVGEQKLRELGADAPRQADQSIAVLGEDLLVYPRFVVITFEIRSRRQPKQVAKTVAVTGQQGQVIGIALVARAP